MTESHHDLHELVGAYLLGALSEAEFDVFEEHLQTCDQCAAEVAADETVMIALAVSDRPVDAGADVIELNVEDPKTVPKRSAGLLLAAAASLVVVVAISIALLRDVDLIDQIARADDTVQVALTEVSNDGDPQTVELTQAPLLRAVAFVDADLPDLPDGERYALWQLPNDDGNPVFLGFVRPDDIVSQAWVMPEGQGTGFAMSVETVTEPPDVPALVAFVGLTDP